MTADIQRSRRSSNGHLSIDDVVISVENNDTIDLIIDVKDALKDLATDILMIVRLWMIGYTRTEIAGMVTIDRRRVGEILTKGIRQMRARSLGGMTPKLE